MDDTTKTVASKVCVLVDAQVSIEPSYRYERFRTAEAKAKFLERWADELRDFFRDHRSMDVNEIHVVREELDQCSECESPWEVNDDDNTCAWCGEDIEEPRGGAR